MSGQQPISLQLVSTNTSPVLTLDNQTLVGFEIPIAVNSTTFTLLSSRLLNGTFVPVIDPFGNISTGGTPLTWTLATTGSGIGYYYVPPFISAGLTHIQVLFSSSESTTIQAILRNIP